MVLDLQAVADDSGSEPQSTAFVLAGFAASAAQWAAFADAWDRVLKKKPKLDYFKSNEAYGLKEQFAPERGWTEAKRDERLIELAGVIRKLIPERFSVAMAHKEFASFIHGIPIPKRFPALENPYFSLCYDFIICVTALHSLRFSKPEPCDFIFDDQNKDTKAVTGWWDRFKSAMTTQTKMDYSGFLKSSPIFRTDTDFPPLQAADLLAGQLRYVMASKTIEIPPRPPLNILREISGYHSVYTPEKLQKFRDRLLRDAAIYESHNPGGLRYRTGQKKPHKKR